MDLKGVEENLSKFSTTVIKRIESDIDDIGKHSAKTQWDKTFQKHVKL